MSIIDSSDGDVWNRDSVEENVMKMSGRSDEMPNEAACQ